MEDRMTKEFRRIAPQYVLTRLPGGGVRLDAPLDRMSVVAPTLGEAVLDMTRAKRGARMVRDTHLFLTSISTVAYDPQRHCYAAECPAAGIKATGFTRQDAWFRLLHGIELRAAELLAAQESEDNVDETEVRGGPDGLAAGCDPDGADVPGGPSDPETV